jgi:hypothetical protein
MPTGRTEKNRTSRRRKRKQNMRKRRKRKSRGKLQITKRFLQIKVMLSASGHKTSDCDTNYP